MSGEENTPAGATTPQCQFFVQRKKRLCRMTVKPGRRYCGEHEPQPTAEAGQVDKRIPCPNDPKHTCYASKLVKHLAICNARRTEQPPYIVHNINAPEEAEACPRRPLSSVPKDELANVIDKINCLYAKHVEGQIAAAPTFPIHPAVVGEFNQAERAESSRRHLRQVSALLALAERAGLAADRTCYVELGAGKGQLSYYACHAWCGSGGSRVLAVDRAPLRHKRDNKLRSAPPTSTPTHGDPAQTELFNDAARSTHNSHGDPAQTELFNDAARSTHNSHGDPAQTELFNDAARSTHSSHGDPATETSTDAARYLRLDPSSDSQKNPTSSINSTSSNSNGISDHAQSIATTDNTNMIDSDRTSNESTDKRDTSQDANTNICSVVKRPSQHRSDGTDSGSALKEPGRESAKDGRSGEWEGKSGEDSDVAVRIRADLAHLALEAVPVVAASKAVVGLAKHLCGVATDYALRCVAAERVLEKTRGIVVATCCHHRVEAAPYVGTRHLQELGISLEELNVMLGIVSWATCGDGRSRERRALAEGEGEGEGEGRTRALSQAEREEVGRRAKALVDWGRVLWLRARGLAARLLHYVAADVSPENRAILALRPPAYDT